MSLYRYRACDAHGRVVRGELEAANPADLETRLRGRGLELLRAAPAAHNVFPFRRRRIARRELIHFCFHLEQLLAAGVPMLDAITDLGDGHGSPAMQAIAAGLRAEIERGQALSAAMASHPHAFDEVFRCLLHAGESTGDPVPALRRIAADLARADELAAHARKIVIYPAIIATLLAAAVVVAITQVVPQIAALFRGDTVLPLSTRILIGLSTWLGHHGWLLPPVFVLLAISATFAAIRYPGFRHALHALSLRLPLLGPIRQRLALARVAGVLAMLYASGITVTDAIASAARATPNLVIRGGLETARAGITAGQGIASAFEATGLFPRLVTRMLRVGEQTGRIDSALGQLAHFYERDAREAIERLQASAEPALTVIMGLLMLWIALAILGPVYDIIAGMPL
ncbi:MAG: type II secretion system F family protein [Azoarcus sp.]|jgi:type IV pilus assembly protein PilC|nr:type II secretion system F family protein [Azoarcus sp.]